MKIIKSWKYSNYDNHIINLYKDRVEDLSTKRPRGRKISKRVFTIQEFFECKYIYSTLEISYEIFKLITENKLLDENYIENNKKYQFWNAIDNKGIKKREIKTRMFDLLIDQSGIFFEMVGENQAYQKLDDFFFFGPNLPGFSLEDRVKIKEEIFNSLDKSKHNLTLDDGFVLFDYSKITPITFKYGDVYSGVIIEVFQDGLSIGGWSNPRDGGASNNSFEALWHNRLDSKIEPIFKNDVIKIRKMLKAAIIE